MQFNPYLTNENFYSQKYRILKTVLLVFAWLTLGCNQELPRVVLEDLKILLDTNYYYISLLLIIRSCGILLVTVFIGIIYDKFTGYSDTIISLGNFILITTNFIMPWTKNYGFTFVLNFMQGCSTAIFEIGTNQMTLNLWHGISNSPINALHAAYGIGGIVALQIAGPWMKFDPKFETLLKNSTIDNNTHLLTSDDIQLKIPFGIGALFGLVISTGFLVAQYYEFRQVENFKRTQQQAKTANMLIENRIDFQDQYDTGKLPIKYYKVQKLLFKNVAYKGNSIYIIFIQLFLIFLLFFVITFFITYGNYFVTYFTKGPQKLKVEDFVQVFTSFWIFYTIGRISAVYIGHKMNSYLFYFLLLTSTLVLIILLVIPVFFDKISSFAILSAVGFASGPLIPSGFMVGKSVLEHVNSFMVAIFCIASNLGAIACRNTTGYLLDNFDPRPFVWMLGNDASSVYIIPYLMMFNIFISIVIFVLIFCIHKRTTRFLKKQVIHIGELM